MESSVRVILAGCGGMSRVWLRFDQARCMTGTDALAVTCHEFNSAWSWYRHGASASAIFEMTGGLCSPTAAAGAQAATSPSGRPSGG